MKSPLALPVLIFNLLLLSATAQAQVAPLHIHQLKIEAGKIPEQVEFNQLFSQDSDNNAYFSHLISEKVTNNTTQLLVIQLEGNSPNISFEKQPVTTKLIEESTGKILRSLHKQYGNKGLKDTVLSSFEAAINKQHLYEIEAYNISYSPYSVATVSTTLNGKKPKPVTTLDFQKQAKNLQNLLTAAAIDKCLEQNLDNFKEFMQKNYKDVLSDLNIFSKFIGNIERTVALDGAVEDVFNDIRRLILKPTFPSKKQSESLDQFSKLPTKLTAFEFSKLPAGNYALEVNLMSQNNMSIKNITLKEGNRYLLLLTTN